MALDDTMRAAMPGGFTEMTLWPLADGRVQANARRTGTDGWHVAIDRDPVVALCRALEGRAEPQGVFA